MFSSFGLLSSLIATACIAITLFSVWPWPSSDEQIAGQNDDRQIGSPGISAVDKNKFSKTRLSYVSSSTRWKSPTDSHKSGDLFTNGETIKLAEGEVELTYSCGTKLLLVGPAIFLVDTSGGRLVRGGLVASVTEAGQGFTIEVPNGKVVDLGTEFGVAVDDFGVSEVSVFQGKVEAFPTIGTANQEKIELLQGDGLQWDVDNVTTHNADIRKFASSALGRQLNIARTDDSSTLVDQFRAATLSPKWKPLGDVKTSSDGLRLSGNGSPSNRPLFDFETRIQSTSRTGQRDV